MKAMTRRVANLERTERDALCPSLKRWLGMPLTDAEEREADRVEAHRTPFDRSEVEQGDYSKEVKAWLLQD